MCGIIAAKRNAIQHKRVLAEVESGKEKEGKAKRGNQLVDKRHVCCVSVQHVKSVIRNSV